MNYKNIIFDLGNVLVKLDEAATMRAFEALGWPKKDHIREYAEGLRLFQAMGVGQMSNKQFFDAFRATTHSWCRRLFRENISLTGDAYEEA